jgi:hypothetical protein
MVGPFAVEDLVGGDKYKRCRDRVAGDGKNARGAAVPCKSQFGLTSTAIDICPRGGMHNQIGHVRDQPVADGIRMVKIELGPCPWHDSPPVLSEGSYQ